MRVLSSPHRNFWVLLVATVKRWLVLKTSIAAVLARNHEGKILGACTYPSQDIVNAFVAEARACERALSFALEMGFQCLQLEGDSLSIIKKLKSKMEDRSVLRPIIQSIHILLRQFEKAVYLFVPRTVNRAAHTLALEGRRCQLPCFWTEEAPNSVRKMAAEDWRVWNQDR
ncbi:hypothetical protein PVK06_041094 [Gossypium arboreum]|uniref:RNase H type-1 domain-containing protein n=1 Tax=Gossypium arboreum TaxID=29729 RepID=A0ABR0N786_GOSAR|nr:hypothetical protein PVK06_041094 [Gossypium arboreum]